MGQRAKMSEGSRFEAVERARSTFEQTALAEARAILAETEPDVERTYNGRAYFLTPHSALAESLRSFV